MSLFSEIEKAVERGFRRWTESMFGKAGAGDLLLVHRAILENVETRIETAQRGRPLFPYNVIKVRLSSPDEHRRSLYIAAFSKDDRLQSNIRELLISAGCDVARDLTVNTNVVECSEPSVEVHYEVRSAVVHSSVGDANARLVVVNGKAAESTYELTRPRTNIGRLAVLLDRDHRPIRRNDIVFEEGGDEVNATVSRSHAHIRREADSGEYRICDDGSEYGTRIFRDGRAIEVPAGSARGERLRSGDEIYFGRACVRFESE